MHPLLFTLLIDELFTHSISLSITVMFMGTFSITISIVIIDPQKNTIPITLPLLMTKNSYITFSFYYPLLGRQGNHYCILEAMSPFSLIVIVMSNFLKLLIYNGMAPSLILGYKESELLGIDLIL